jgi:hypothetical protein
MKHLFVVMYVLLFLTSFTLVSLTGAGLAELKAALDKKRRDES